MAQANQGRKANTFTEIDALADDSAFFVLQKIGGVRKARQLTKEAFALQFGEMFNHPIEVTYAELLALATASELKLGVKYMITNATSASINLEVEAISTSEIHCDAKDPLYPNDKVMYNFASNVITWRWDTINDISAGEDWRNSNDISIGTGCSHIEIGANCVIAIGNNCVNIKLGNNVGASSDDFIGDGCENIEIGNDATIKIFAGSTFVKAGNSVGIELLAVSTLIYVADGSSIATIANKPLNAINIFGGSIAASNSIQNLNCYTSADISAATFIYDIAQHKTMQDGASNLPRLIYLNNTNTLVNVDAEV